MRRLITATLYSLKEMMMAVEKKYESTGHGIIFAQPTEFLHHRCVT